MCRAKPALAYRSVSRAVPLINNRGPSLNVFMRHDRASGRSIAAGSATGKCLLVAVLLLSHALAQAAYRTVIDAPAPLKALLTDFLDLVRYQERADMSEEQLNFMIATASEQVARLAATEGYFSTKTTVSLEKDTARPVVHLKVEPGKRTMVEKLSLDISGAVTSQSPAQAEEMRRGWSLRSGEPFRQADWATAKQEALDVLTRRRYPAARLIDSQARVDADASAATLSASYDSGPLFTLGAVRVNGTRRYPESIVRNVSPLHVGEQYSVDRLLEFQRQVLRTPYFSNVVIDIDRNPDNATAALVNVEVTEFPTQRIRGGAGYTTDTGVHLEGLYSNADMFGRAYVLDAQLRLEQRRQFGTLTLSKPPNADGFVDSVHVSTDRTTLAGVDLRSRRLGVRRAQESERTRTAYTVEYYSDRLTQLDGAVLPADTVVEPGTHQAVVLGVERTLRRVDSLVFPREGTILTGQAGVAFKGILTDQTFLRAYGRATRYLPIAKRDVVILRAELGTVISKGGNSAIPASLLFRAGGTDSVRGYGYQTIGNVRGGTVYPTRFLATGSAEYQHWLSEQWGAAVFYDVGTAADCWREKSLFHAVGAGARFRSPVGTVNADLAYGIQSRTIRPHLSLGVAF